MALPIRSAECPPADGTGPTADRTSSTRSRTLTEATAHTRPLTTTAYELYDQLGLQRARVRVIGLRASNLRPASEATQQLTFDPVGERAPTCHPRHPHQTDRHRMISSLPALPPPGRNGHTVACRTGSPAHPKRGSSAKKLLPGKRTIRALLEGSQVKPIDANRLLGAATALYSVAIMVRPEWLARPCDLPLDSDGRPPLQAGLLIRAIGARDTAIAIAMTVADTESTRRSATWCRVAGDTADAVLFGTLLERAGTLEGRRVRSCCGSRCRSVGRLLGLGVPRARRPLAVAVLTRLLVGGAIPGGFGRSTRKVRGARPDGRQIRSEGITILRHTIRKLRL
ncbi:hypothetical protein ACIGD1_26095 [Streptomyces sp. NPDC085612]|uniref:DinB/UmuC family translesion DNA polymerase n=1 Tax=Streptomyces sp. NPDC085612 TaxID=3365732 RepID=UPI0037D4DFEB